MPGVVKKRFFKSGREAVAELDSRTSAKIPSSPTPRRSKHTDNPTDGSRKVSSFGFYPTLAFPEGFHGVNASFLDSETPGSITSVQAYSQFARHFSIPDKKDFDEDQYLDSHAMRSRCLVKKANLLQLFKEMAEKNSFGPRIEIGVCVSALNKSGISEAVYKALQFYSQCVVPFETTPLLQFSFTWACFAINLELLSIECLKNSIFHLTDRICHLTLVSCYSDLLRQFSLGRTFSASSTRLVKASSSLNFPLLPRPSKKISAILDLNSETLHPIEDPCTTTNNYYASVYLYFL